MENASVSSVITPVTVGPAPGQIQEINAAVLRGVTGFLKRLPAAYAQQFVGDPSLVTDAVAQALELILPRRMTIPHAEVERWNRYYRDEHGIAHSFEGLEIPAEAEYPTRLIVMHAEVSARPQRIASVYQTRCNDNWWQFSRNLDVAVPRHVRLGTYAIRVRDVPEAPDGFDEECQKNLSSRDIWNCGWFTTTLPERLVDGDMYLRERNAHLDRKVVTVCAGSRSVDGSVPSVYLCDDGSVDVDYWDPDFADDYLRFRRAIV